MMRLLAVAFKKPNGPFRKLGVGAFKTVGAERKKAGHEMKCFLPSFTCSFNLKQQSVRQFLLLIHSVPAAGLAEHTDRVETEGPPAGDFRRSSGQSSGRGSSVRNIRSSATSGAPVIAGASVLTGDLCSSNLNYKRFLAQRCI